MRNLALPLDTTVEAARVQLAVLRRLGIDHCARMAFELSDNVRHIAEIGVRDRHPEYTPDQLRLAVIRDLLGDDLFDRAYASVGIGS
jgi:hypothetical protein